jgi:hypothetical protein
VHCELVADVQVTMLVQNGMLVHGVHGPGLPFKKDPTVHEVQSLAVGPLQLRQDGSQAGGAAFAGSTRQPSSNVVRRPASRRWVMCALFLLVERSPRSVDPFGGRSAPGPPRRRQLAYLDRASVVYGMMR